MSNTLSALLNSNIVIKSGVFYPLKSNSNSDITIYTKDWFHTIDFRVNESIHTFETPKTILVLDKDIHIIESKYKSTGYFLYDTTHISDKKFLMVFNSIYSTNILDDRVDFLHTTKVLKEDFINKYPDLFTEYVNFLLDSGSADGYSTIKNYLEHGTDGSTKFRIDNIW